MFKMRLAFLLPFLLFEKAYAFMTVLKDDLLGATSTLEDDLYISIISSSNRSASDPEFGLHVLAYRLSTLL